MTTDSRRTLSAIVAELERAWNAGDGEGFARPFTDDADFVNIRGEHSRTRPVIARGHQGIFDSIYKDSVVHYDVAAVRALAPGVMVGQVKGHLRVPTGPLAREYNALATLVLVEQQGTWQIAVFHNTLVAQA